MRSVPPYSLGGTLSARGEICAIRMQRRLTKWRGVRLPDNFAGTCWSSGKTMPTRAKDAVAGAGPATARSSMLLELRGCVFAGLALLARLGRRLHALLPLHALLSLLGALDAQVVLHFLAAELLRDLLD